MIVYLVIRETKWRIPCSYGDHGDYWETDTDIISAHRNRDDAIKMVETETALNTSEDVCYYWYDIELS